MLNTKILALILLAGAAASSSLHAGAILQLYSERVRPDELRSDDAADRILQSGGPVAGVLQQNSDAKRAA
jgi:hypothetical protein